MMDTERLLLWRQGVHLQPQHFQLLDRSLQSLLGPYQDHAIPHFWGIANLAIQEAALNMRTFEVLKGKFLFDDGAYASYPENAILETRTFDEAWVDGGKPLTVYIGVKHWDPDSENVSVIENVHDSREINTRFVSPAAPEEIKDLHSGGSPGHVERLFYLLKVFYGTELDELGSYSLIPIARLDRMGDDIVLSKHFIPPSLSIAASEPLLNVLKEVRDQIASRGRQLETMKRQRGIQTAEFGSRDMIYLLALRSLNRYIPSLWQFTETNQVHPWMAYGLLRQIVGELTSFSEKVDVLGRIEAENWTLPIYDHKKLGGCFRSAQTLIARLLDEITAGPEYVIRLVYDGTYFAADLKPAIFDGRSRYYLVIKTEADPAVVLDSIAAVAKLSSREHMPLLIARALPSINLQHLPVPPQELPRRAHTLYFAADHHGEQWARVEKGNNIAFYWDKAPKDLEVELMVVTRQ